MMHEFAPSVSRPPAHNARAQEREETVFWFARDIQQQLRYARWENFGTLIKRARGLIETGEATGLIKKTTRRVGIGSGARRSIVDYELDTAAVNLLRFLSAGFKLNGHYPIRNECVLLRLLEKYYEAKGVLFEFQARRGEAIFDAVVGDVCAVEIDEPHHASKRQGARDRNKDKIARQYGLSLRRFSIVNDVIDILLVVDKVISSNTTGQFGDRGDVMPSPGKDLLERFLSNRVGSKESVSSILAQGDRAFFGRLAQSDGKRSRSGPDDRSVRRELPPIVLKAKDFANEITNYNIKRDELRSELEITDEHVKNNTDVRRVLTDRGIKPELLPPDEDSRS